ncbi:hypothetical protein GH741_12820 [Aquibacillus halophilus]|uniref:Uncharacterized protein n=1 Tax=Aquibacillus halophilus TaxID=930132 RepID=A0A6A8DD14_9BACI|nr:hypothetical protein [Aquibacillus halophilus]MRH43563.1 hypothetical protein [Aquibacillus halophilus]
MTKQKKTIWIIGNILIGISAFLAYLWGILRAWGDDGGIIWTYPIGAVTVVLVVFGFFNSFIISSEKAKQWGLSVVILLGSVIATMVVHGILQNTILE